MRIKRVTKLREVQGIKELQAANLKKNLTGEEIQREGFVTAEYSLEFLSLMNQIEPSVISVDSGQVVGYALVATKELLGRHDLLDDLFSQIDSFSYQGKPLLEANYIVVGQLCVAKAHRGKGLSQKMYEFYKSELSDKYDFCLTDVQISNPGSIKAHLKTGFEILGDLSYGGTEWKIVIWDWLKHREP